VLHLADLVVSVGAVVYLVAVVELLTHERNDLLVVVLYVLLVRLSIFLRVCQLGQLVFLSLVQEFALLQDLLRLVNI
jgi:hypothetical protein